MTKKELQQLIAQGEDSCLQFKADIRNADSLAAEMVAFSNGHGGRILIGVNNDGQQPGLSREDVERLNQLISNAASQHIRSPINPLTENVAVGRGRVVIVLTVPAGFDKPYFDRKGVIWLKSGADKRRIQSKEELRRLFQAVDLLRADEVPTKATIKALDKLRFRDFLRDVYGMDLPGKPKQLEKLLENMNLAQDSRLNLAGLLLFGEQPQFIKPTCMIKAAAFPGNDVTAKAYLDSEDFEGPLPAQFNGAMGFIMRNLRKVQAGRGVNTLGESEIPRSVFEELVVNALIHRDYFICAPIRIFVFTNRIEIISPGHLPNNLTIEKIKAGNSNIRNSTLVRSVILDCWAVWGYFCCFGLGMKIGFF